MPEYKVKVDNPNLMDEVEVEVPGVGRLKNRGEEVTAELPEEDAQHLATAFGVEVSGINKQQALDALKEQARLDAETPVVVPVAELQPEEGGKTVKETASIKVGNKEGGEK